MANTHVSGKRADYSPNDRIFTPASVFDALGLRFDLDPAHPPMPTNVPCKRYYTEQDDGLKQNWHGLVWLNPPFSNPTPWADKWLDHANGLMLCQMSRAKWFNRLWESNAAMTIMPNNFGFEKDGKKHTIFMPVALFALGEQASIALLKSGLGSIR